MTIPEVANGVHDEGARRCHAIAPTCCSLDSKAVGSSMELAAPSELRSRSPGPPRETRQILRAALSTVCRRTRSSDRSVCGNRVPCGRTMVSACSSSMIGMNSSIMSCLGSPGTLAVIHSSKLTPAFDARPISYRCCTCVKRPIRASAIGENGGPFNREMRQFHLFRLRRPTSSSGHLDAFRFPSEGGKPVPHCKIAIYAIHASAWQDGPRNHRTQT